jgi:hypothetical protein
MHNGPGETQDMAHEEPHNFGEYGTMQQNTNGDIGGVYDGDD